MQRLPTQPWDRVQEEGGRGLGNRLKPRRFKPPSALQRVTHLFEFCIVVIDKRLFLLVDSVATKGK